MKRPLQLVTIPVQETEIWKSDTYRHKFDLTFICLNGFNPDNILKDTLGYNEWQDKTFPLPEDTGDRLFEDYLIGRSFKFFTPKVSIYKGDSLSPIDMERVRILGYIAN